MFLRFPGQWREGAWDSENLTPGLYYNVYRSLETQTGRYTRPDPANTAAVERFLSLRAVGDERFGLFAYVDGNPLLFVDPLGLLRVKGCRKNDEQQIARAFKNYCSRVEEPALAKCLCDKPSIPRGLKRQCSSPAVTVRCSYEEVGNCARLRDGRRTCAWSQPFGSTVRLCPAAWSPTCGPLGCTLMHEMTHQLGYGGEKWPDKVEECLGCN